MMQQEEFTDIEIPVGEINLMGDLILPKNSHSIIVFAHGSGSGRFSSRNQYVAEVLQEAGFGTLLMDLLTQKEEEIDRVTAELRFDIPFLAHRILATKDWLSQHSETKSLQIGYFGASTGAGAALIAAAQSSQNVFAVVSRGGRPDLAAEYLPSVKAPTLLIVGGDDTPVIKMNQDAAALLTAEHELKIIPGATHLFEEPGKLEKVAQLSRDWFLAHSLNSAI